MDDPGLVDGDQARGDAGADPGGHGRLEGALRAHEPAQVPAADVVHDQGQAGALDDQVAEPHDQGARHLLEDLALPQEGLHHGVLQAQVVAQDLEGQRLRGAPGTALPDLALGAGPDTLLEDVQAAQVPPGVLQVGAGVGGLAHHHSWEGAEDRGPSTVAHEPGADKQPAAAPPRRGRRGGPGRLNDLTER